MKVCVVLMRDLNYSVLMSVYYKEEPEYLRESILSMLEQSIAPQEIVIVKDGSLTKELEKVLEDFRGKEIIKIISLSENLGLGEALKVGVNECSNEIIARMDTDDISDKFRCEKQLILFQKNNELSVLGTAIAEFIDNPSNVVAYKKVETKTYKLHKIFKYKNPMNHPSVMFKKNDVIEAGNYQHLELNEDYYLWIRMREMGYVFHNIDEPLVKMRVTNETYLRRGGWKYFIAQKKLFDYMLKHRIINITEYLTNNIVRFVLRVLVTNKVRKWFYLKVLRE